jgi:hypothetical protein
MHLINIYLSVLPKSLILDHNKQIYMKTDASFVSENFRIMNK